MVPLLLALIFKKAENKALDLENCMPNSSANKAKRVRSSLPSTSNLVIAVMSKSIGPMVGKGKMKPVMMVA